MYILLCDIFLGCFERMLTISSNATLIYITIINQNSEACIIIRLIITKYYNIQTNLTNKQTNKQKALYGSPAELNVCTHFMLLDEICLIYYCCGAVAAVIMLVFSALQVTVEIRNSVRIINRQNFK